MCWLNNKQKTIEEIVAEKSADMTDAQKAQYWFELSQNIFALLGKVDVSIVEITPDEWIQTVKLQYPTITDVKIADSIFFTTNLDGLQKILTRDWSNLVPYISEISDCDKFATRLYSHLCDYYRINAIVPVFGETDAGYHAFNLAVLYDDTKYIARLVEPQTDQIFIDTGPLGKYIPRMIATELGVIKHI
jgi:hypothetical protein